MGDGVRLEDRWAEDEWPAPMPPTLDSVLRYIGATNLPLEGQRVAAKRAQGLLSENELTLLRSAGLLDG